MDEQRKKVLYVITKDDVGGAQKYVADLASHLDRASFDIRVIRGGVDIPSLSNKIAWYALFANDWRALFSLMSVYRKEHPDIIHLNSSKAGVIGSFAAFLYNHLPFTIYHLPAKVIFTAHGWVFNPSNALSPVARFVYIRLHRMAAYFQNYIICVSEYDYKLALRYAIAPSKKLTTIHNGIDYQNLTFLDKVSARKAIISKLPITNYPASPAGGQLLVAKPWIGSIGRLTKEKDYATLIQAAALVPNAYFFIIGAGPEYSKLQLLITNYPASPAGGQLQDRFFLIPPTGDDAKFLKAFDLFTLTSVKEGLPYALLESCAAGIPAVVTDAGGMPEVVMHDATGMVVPQKNPERLSRAFQELMRDHYRAQIFGKEARHRLQTEFSLSLMIQKTEALYRASC
jgi:glycosyltransferase involved in cell wall biosynthesis